MHKKAFYVNPTKGRLIGEEMVAEIVGFVKEDSKSFYRVVVGTDSRVKRLNGVAECDYVTAIVIHRVGQGARYFWRKERVKVHPVLREKIYMETTMSLDTAHVLIPEIRRAINGSGKYEMEIHIDVGEKGKTRDMINEVVGMVVGNGFVARTKPEAWGASSVADRHT